MPASWPLLAQPWAGGVAGWLVVSGGLVCDIVAGILTNPVSALVAAPVLALPAVIGVGLSIVQFRQARSCGADLVSWWHLTGVALAAVIWLAWPTSYGVLYGVSSARNACLILVGGRTPTADCLVRATQALDSRNAAWWLTGLVILMMALLTRRARMAPWAAIPIALAGCLIATHFLELLTLHYHPGG